MTTVTTGLPLKVARLDIAPGVEAAAWATKHEALTALGELHTRGLNVDVEIEAHRVRLPLARVWVLARPDHYDGVTYLMTAAGAWLRGRLVDQAPCYHNHGTTSSWEAHPVPWQPLTADVFPAPFTHVTRTVPHSGPQREQERYRTKSNGSCGRWVRGDDSVALCTCGWKRYEQTRPEAQAAARAHRANPDRDAPALAVAVA